MLRKKKVLADVNKTGNCYKTATDLIYRNNTSSAFYLKIQGTPASLGLLLLSLLNRINENIGLVISSKRN